MACRGETSQNTKAKPGESTISKTYLEDVVYKRFFDKIKREREEWLAKDLVVDRREGWRNWVWRQFNFEEAPLVPREELPDYLQPQNSIRGKVVNYINGVDPRLP